MADIFKQQNTSNNNNNNNNNERISRALFHVKHAQLLVLDPFKKLTR